VSVTDDELARYARHIVLPEFGGAGQARLGRATVAVVGAGGIGSPAIQYLAGSGIGRLVLIDDDRVETSNLQRQTIFAAADAGSLKVEAARAFVARFNPHVMVEPSATRLDPGNAVALLSGADVILDGCDGFATRLAVADAALGLRVPLVSAAVGQFEGQLAVYRGWESDRPCYRCFVGDSPTRDGTSCAEDGILGPVAGVLGTLAAVEAIRAASPFGEDPAGTLLLIDLLAFRFRTLRLPKDPGCSGCGQVPV
jgi:adenylyltransferase/sulfurtransferase